MKTPNSELIDRAINGDSRSFNLLMAPRVKYIKAAAYSFFDSPEERNDATTDIITKIFFALNRYNPQYAFSTWVNCITKNYCLDTLKKRKLDTVSIDDFIKTTVSSKDLNIEEQIIKLDEYDQLLFTLKKVNVRFYKTLTLFYVQQKSYLEIANELKMPISIIKNHLHRGRKEIRKIYFSLNK